MVETLTADAPHQDFQIQAERVRNVSQRTINLLAERIPPERVVDQLAKLLTATRTGKNGVVTPDVRAIEAGLKLWLAYGIGLPVQRSEVVSVNLDADSSVGITDRLAKSPALRDQLRKALAEADAAAGVVDVPAVEHA